MHSVAGSDVNETLSHKKTDSKDKSRSSEDRPCRYYAFRSAGLRIDPLCFLLLLLLQVLLPGGLRIQVKMLPHMWSTLTKCEAQM